jgi:outer membrane protein assembly factor BamB
VLRGWTTISCRAFALTAFAIASFALFAALPAEARGAKAEPGAPKAVDDQRPPPQLPLASFWSVELKGVASAPPVSEGDRVFIALTSAHLTARSVADGRELWRIEKVITAPMVAGGGLLFVAAAESIEALRVADGGTAWIAPRLKTIAPLIVRGDWLIAVTESEIVAIRATDGQVVWRHAAAGVHLAPDIDGEYLYAGANDGAVVALTLSSGAEVWQEFVTGGVTAIAARGGRVYVGGGDNLFYCLDGRGGAKKWDRRIGAPVIGRIAVDDERVYFAALNNVVYGLDRSSGVQRWKTPVSRRPFAGVVVLGHVVFVPAVTPRLIVLYDFDGEPSGIVPLPGEIQNGLPPDIRETPAGLQVFAVTGGLSTDWQLSFLAPADEASLVPISAWPMLPGVGFLTDPELGPLGSVLGELILGDPPLRPMSQVGWPVVLEDPPLAPLTALPGLLMRPLSPTLPIRPGG